MEVDIAEFRVHMNAWESNINITNGIKKNLSVGIHFVILVKLLMLGGYLKVSEFLYLSYYLNQHHSKPYW